MKAYPPTFGPAGRYLAGVLWGLALGLVASNCRVTMGDIGAATKVVAVSNQNIVLMTLGHLYKLGLAIAEPSLYRLCAQGEPSETLRKGVSSGAL